MSQLQEQFQQVFQRGEFSIFNTFLVGNVLYMSMLFASLSLQNFRPVDFKGTLEKYSDWDKAESYSSHDIMKVMKYYFCTKGSEISKESAADDFLYDTDFKENNITKSFSSDPGKEVIHYQLTADCGAGEIYFHIHFPVFKRTVHERANAIQVGLVLRKDLK